MEERRRRLEGNLRPNRFSLTRDDEYDDTLELSNGAKVKSLTIKVQKATEEAVKQITKLKSFPEYCQGLNQFDIDAASTDSLCLYFESLHSTLKKFQATLNDLNANNPKIKKMQNNFETLHRLIAEGNDLAVSKKYHDSIEVYAKALKMKPSNNSIKLGLLYDYAFASSKIGNFRDAIVQYL